MAILSKELKEAREAIRTAGGDPDKFTFAACDKAGGDGAFQILQYVEVNARGLKSRVYRTGHGVSWTDAFKSDLKGGAFRLGTEST